jgi:hypothetical protein
MRKEVQLDYRRRPSALAFMGRALRPSPGLRRAGVPAITARWRHRVDGAELRQFLALSGLPDGTTLPLLYPYTIGFPLQMAILTQPAFPVPIWQVLQVRNRILQHVPLAKDALLDIAVSIAGHRILDKGAEFDLHATVQADGRTAWESVITFYVRGRFGRPQPDAAPAAAPAVEEGASERWRMPEGGGMAFGKLSGDYNGIHLWGWYARRFGFRRAFFHPQRVLGQCVARVPALDPAQPQQLDAWLKGPVFYGAQVALRVAAEQDGALFALNVNDDSRPAIVGRLHRAAPGTRLGNAA